MLFDHALRERRRQCRHRQTGNFLHVECARILRDRLHDLGFAGVALTLLGDDAGRAASVFETVADTIVPSTIAYSNDGVERVVATTASLPALAAVMGLHWVNDLPGVLRQCELALATEGLFVAAFVGGGSLRELRFALQQAELAILGGASSRISPFLDIADAAALMARAGFSEPVVDLVTLHVTYPTPLVLMHELRAMNETNALLGGAPKPLRRDVLVQACQLYQQHFPAANGRISATFDIICLTGWAKSAA